MQRVLPAKVIAELRRVAVLPHPWLVADMDSTLIRKAPGEWPDLSTSPVRPHLCEWLKTGGSLLVVTSDDGHRPWRSVLRHIPEALRARVVLSTADGAVLSRLNEATGEFAEDRGYWDTAAGDGCETGLPSPSESIDIACRMKREFLCDALSDRSLLGTVSPEWRREQYHELLGRFGRPAELAEFLTNERMRGMNAVMKRGSMVWCNQAERPEFWDIQDDAEWRQRISQKLSEAAVRREAEEAGDGGRGAPRWTNCFVLGMSSAISSPYVERHLGSLDALGATASAAPNSVLVKNAMTDKGLPIRWLNERGLMKFKLASAVAFGDNPGGNDASLTRFVAGGMPFVSVAEEEAHTPEHLRDFHVGGLEEGTAACIDEMVRARLVAHPASL